MKCIYIRAPGHTVDCSEFIWGIYTDILFSYLHSGETSWLLLRFSRTELCWVSRVIFHRWSERDHLSRTVGKALLYMFIVKTSWRMELVKLIWQLYLENGFERALCQWNGGRLFCTLTVQVFPGRALMLIWQLFLKDGLEMDIYQWGRLCTSSCSFSERQSFLSQYDRFIWKLSWNGRQVGYDIMGRDFAWLPLRSSKWELGLDGLEGTDFRQFPLKEDVVVLKGLTKMSSCTLSL